MRLSSILFIVTTASAQSPFANTLDVSRAIRQFTTSFLNDLGETTESGFKLDIMSVSPQSCPPRQTLSSRRSPSTRCSLNSCSGPRATRGNTISGHDNTISGVHQEPADPGARPDRQRGGEGPVLQPGRQHQVRETIVIVIIIIIIIIIANIRSGSPL